MHFINCYQSPLGNITLASDGETLTGVWFDEQKYFAEKSDTNAKPKELPIFNRTKHWLDIYFSGKAPNFTPPLKMLCSDFRKAVWNVMLSIPFGETMTYGAIAHIIARQKGIGQMSAQAIGGAVGHNAISIIIPCHRVIGKNGNLTGYAGGLNKKIKLLQLEKINTDNFFLPQYGSAL